MSDVYEMMNTSNDDTNILTVDFSFESSVKKAKAIVKANVFHEF